MRSPEIAAELARAALELARELVVIAAVVPGEGARRGEVAPVPRARAQRRRSALARDDGRRDRVSARGGRRRARGGRDARRRGGAARRRRRARRRCCGATPASTPRSRPRARRSRDPATALLVVLGDVAAADPREVAQLLDAGAGARRRARAVARRRHLGAAAPPGRRDPGALRPGQRQAAPRGGRGRGRRARRAALPSLAIDVDRAEDARAILALPTLGARTRALLEAWARVSARRAHGARRAAGGAARRRPRGARRSRGRGAAASRSPTACSSCVRRSCRRPRGGSSR